MDGLAVEPVRMKEPASLRHFAAKAAPFTTAQLKLRGLDPAARYT